MTDGASVAIVIIVIVIVMVWIIGMFVMFHNQTGVFGPYIAPVPPAEQKPFYPTGDILSLSQAQQDDRNAQIKASLNQAD
jgi:hypothetical protein